MTAQARALSQQLTLRFDAGDSDHTTLDAVAAMKRFPRTRYQGSKRRLAGAIVNELRDLHYETVLDAFGGTGSVAYAFKAIGKSVTYNDLLAFNHQIGLALIENDGGQLDPDIAADLGACRGGVRYGDLIARTLAGIYFTEDENIWLDRAVANIDAITNRYARAVAWFSLCQAAMAKRPYNLFHRRNLYMRTASVARGFGNKTTWDRSFPEHMRRYATEANRALIDGRGSCRAIRNDVLDIPPDFDLVYVDPPYVNASGVGVDYRDFYHFLEGIMRYKEWSDHVDTASKHRRLKPIDNPWADPNRIGDMFRALFERFQCSSIVVSYRNDGIPTMEALVASLRRVKRHVRVVDGRAHQYVLSTNRQSREMLLVGSD